MSSPAPAATLREREAESPSSAGEPTRDVIKEDDDTVAETKSAELDHGKSETASEGQVDESDAESLAGDEDAAPPLPNEPVPDGPPLPNEPVPTPEDDGWDCQWDASAQAWFFYNRFTGKTQWDNPRVPTAASAVASSAQDTGSGSVPQPPANETASVGGYNPAIHGDYDPNAWYAKGTEEEDDASAALSTDPSAVYNATVGFNRFNGSFQTGDAGPERHSDEAKAKRQMNAYFDVDAAANAHGGRSLKAERSNKKPSKNELKAFKEKRRARKEEKRRAWLRD
ncbi:WW domain-containing protein C2F3.14c [Cladobotryum mycophilum]|uniref:WW domain-containing protein C2F3.14c n=1 Tax=Cladobotryum mycophilum TaxID=491253 RepID=A0ABR0SD94_9HYPO